MFDQQSVGSSPGCDTCVVKQDTSPWLLRKVWEVVLSTLPARLQMDDTQAYICMDCEGGNPVSASGVGGNDPWQKHIVARTLR